MEEAFQETKIHGSLEFPFIVYRGKIPEFIRNFPLHWHEEFELIYIMSGTGCISVKSETYRCAAGDVVVVPPGYIHALFQYKNKAMEYFNILFKCSLLEADENSICYRKYFAQLFEGTEVCFSAVYNSAQSSLAKKITPYVKALIVNRKKATDGYELMVKSNLFAIMNYVRLHLVPATDDDAALESHITKFKETLKYVHKNYSQRITIEDVAAISNVSPSYFMKRFKEFSGRTFVDYLNCYRLGVASDELKSTDKSVIEISGDCGFRNFSYFIRSFKKQFGVTPLAYRHREEAR